MKKNQMVVWARSQHRVTRNFKTENAEGIARARRRPGTRTRGVKTRLAGQHVETGVINVTSLRRWTPSNTRCNSCYSS